MLLHPGGSGPGRGSRFNMHYHLLSHLLLCVIYPHPYTITAFFSPLPTMFNPLPLGLGSTQTSAYMLWQMSVSPRTYGRSGLTPSGIHCAHHQWLLLLQP